MRAVLIACLLLGATSLSAAPAAKFYKWVDKDGVVHYDATAPKDQQTTEVRAADRKPAPAAAQAAEETSTEAAAAPAVASKVDAAACQSARDNLKTLQSNPTILRAGKDGGPAVRLNAEEVEAAFKEAQEQIAQYCEPAG